MQLQLKRIFNLQTLLIVWIILVNLLFYVRFLTMHRSELRRVVQFISELLSLR